MTSHHMEFEEPTRRRFLFVTTGVVAAFGVPFAAWPFVDQMNPDSTSIARAVVHFDLSTVAEGETKVMHLGTGSFLVRHRTAKEISDARSTILTDLTDPLSRNSNHPKKDASDVNRSVHEDGRYLVVSPYCTFGGCELLAGAGRYGGWFCPCCGSHYDSSGRTRLGPAPTNLEVPYFQAVSGSSIEIDRLS